MIHAMPAFANSIIKDYCPTEDSYIFTLVE
jgi:hypothetical protein